MGNIENTNNFIINEDGSITRSESPGSKNKTPDFIPVSLSKFIGSNWKKLRCWLLFLLIFAIHCAAIGCGIYAYDRNESVSYYWLKYNESKLNQSEENSYWDSPQYYNNHYVSALEERNLMIALSSTALVLAIILDIFVVPRLRKNYPNKKTILKGVDYVQADLQFNYGYPYIMTENKIGVLNVHAKRVIIPPEYDRIYWVIRMNVLCAVVNDKPFFFDIKGNKLTNVPSSYYTQHYN